MYINVKFYAKIMYRTCFIVIKKKKKQQQKSPSPSTAVMVPKMNVTRRHEVMRNKDRDLHPFTWYVQFSNAFDDVWPENNQKPETRRFENNFNPDIYFCTH